MAHPRVFVPFTPIVMLRVDRHSYADRALSHDHVIVHAMPIDSALSHDRLADDTASTCSLVLRVRDKEIKVT